MVVVLMVVMVRVVRSNSRGATVVRGHHFGDVGSRRTAESHPGRSVVEELKVSPSREEQSWLLGCNARAN